MKYSVFTPLKIVLKERRQKLALLLVIIFTPVTLFNFSLGVSAAETAIWDESVFSAGVVSNVVADDVVKLSLQASSSDDTYEDFTKGRVYDDGYFGSRVSAEGSVMSAQGYVYEGFNILHSWVHEATGVLYYGASDGLHAVDTKGTETPVDDEELIVYNESSVPALDVADDTEYVDSFIDPATDFLYIVIRRSNLHDKNGVQVIDTKGTKSVADDEFVTKYTRSGSTARVANDEDVMGCEMDFDISVLYCSGNDNSHRFAAISTQGDADPSNDTSIMYTTTGVINTTNGVNTVVSATPKLSSENGAQYDGMEYDEDNGVVYIADNTFGLVAITTEKTATTTDDRAYIYKTTGIFETTNNATGVQISSESFPASVGGYTVGYILAQDNYVLVTTDDSVVVIDTKNTVDPADDDVTATYGPFSADQYTGYSTHLLYENNNLYISSPSGLIRIETNGTLDVLADDSELTFYSSETEPSLRSNSVFHTYVRNGKTYASGELGLHVLTPAVYQSSGVFLGSPRLIASTPTTSLSISSTQTVGQSVDLSYRTGDADAAYLNDFDDNSDSEYVGDYYSWGSSFLDSEESSGTLKLSNPDSYGTSPNDGVDFWIDTGKSAGFFPVGSTVSARVRINSNTRGLGTWSQFMYADDWYDGSAGEAVSNNEWKILSFNTVFLPFSRIGFEVVWESGTWSPTDTFEIDWIRIVPPDDFAGWGSWVSCEDAEHCVLADISSDTWLQYKLDLSTTDTSTTPEVEKVTYQGDYESTGTYTSGREVFAHSRDLGTFTVDADVPADTSVSYQYSIDGGETWSSVIPGQNLASDDVVASSFMWRATLSTTNPAYTPTINSVSLTHSGHSSSVSTSLQTQIDRLEANGNHDAVEKLKQRYPHLFDGTASDEEIQREMVSLLEEVVGHFHEWVRLRKEGS